MAQPLIKATQRIRTVATLLPLGENKPFPALPSILLERTTPLHYMGTETVLTNLTKKSHNCIIFKFLINIIFIPPYWGFSYIFTRFWVIRDCIATLSHEWFRPEVMLFLPYCRAPLEGSISRLRKARASTWSLFWSKFPARHTPSSLSCRQRKQRNMKKCIYYAVLK